MAFLSGIKDRLFAKQQRELSRNPEAATNCAPVHPDTARDITVLFVADSAEDRKAVDRWRDERKKGNRKIKVVGYFEQEVGAASFDFSVITVKDLSFNGTPAGPAVTELQKAKTELLICLGPAGHRIRDYLAATTGADLKVGPYSDDPANPYHIQFDTAPAPGLKQQLAAIAAIFSFTNASK